MKSQAVHQETFKKGSKTYFNSSLFFPEKVRHHVFILYGFVRVADNHVDAIPQEKEEFYRFCSLYRKALAGEWSGDPIIDDFVKLSGELRFPPEWAEGFLKSMEMDLSKSEYNTLDETLDYIYGSAEVIGLYMARIMGLPEKSYPHAMMLGRSMQYINFIRDIDEDNRLGRRYLPLNPDEQGLFKPENVLKEKVRFETLIRRHLKQYLGWQKEAEKGYPMIPYRYLIPIKTASDMYEWTARQIDKNPLIIFKKKVKPSKIRILAALLSNAVMLLFRKKIND